MTEIKPDDLLGAWEVAGVLGVTKQAVFNRRREGTFPEPFRQLRMGPIWLRSQIEPLKKKKKTARGNHDSRNIDS